MNLFKKIILIISILMNFTVAATERKLLEMRPGDLVLMSYNCFGCLIIENETSSKYSHIGVVLSNNGGKITLAQSVGNVHQVKLKKFLKNSRVKTRPGLFRSYQLDELYISQPEKFEEFAEDLNSVFWKSYNGLGFDHQYLWDNIDGSGKEKLYCAEFITKLLNHFLWPKMLPLPMTFDRNFDFWDRYFRGNIPAELDGVSPASFTRSALFFKVFDLDEIK